MVGFQPRKSNLLTIKFKPLNHLLEFTDLYPVSRRFPCSDELHDRIHIIHGFSQGDRLFTVFNPWDMDIVDTYMTKPFYISWLVVNECFMDSQTIRFQDCLDCRHRWQFVC